MTTTTWSAPSGKVDALSARKLEAFAEIEADFIDSFLFVQDVHGRRRFTSFPLADVVRYLHALYTCERKDRLLSVLKNIERYEGERCLRLLRGWQEGQTAEVVAFIHAKLDNQPFAEVSRHIEQAEHVGDMRTARRLASGRMALLNRNVNLSHALDAIFAQETARLRAEVSALCARSGHTPDAINRQIVELRSDIYTYAPSAPLARRNMLLMNHIGIQIAESDGESAPPPAAPAPPFAEEMIPGERTLISLRWHGSEAAGHPLGPATTTLPPANG